MKPETKFSCYIIGRGTLPIQCAEIVLRAGHEICGVISADEAIARWATEKCIAQLKPGSGLKAYLRQTPFDYLFSIVNEHILDDEMLALPRKLAINYHDAPLPQYAGTHATSWALLNQEQFHGMTWHVASKQVDAGDILKQRRIEIGRDETAFSLNTKCYEAAIQSFAELVDDLASGQAQRARQDLGQRTFFPRFQRPPAGGLIAWDRPAAELAALVRALDFGPHPNPLGVAKFAVGSDFIIAREVEILDSATGKSPGTITAISENRLVVSTATRELALHRLCTIDGQPLTTDEIIARYQLSVGGKLSLPDEAARKSVETLYATCCKHEVFWTGKLAGLQPLVLPYAAPGATHATASQIRRLAMPLPPEVMSFLTSRATGNVGEVLLAAWAAYLGRIGGTACFDVGFSDSSLRGRLAGLESLFASHVPLRIEIGEEQNFAGLFSFLQTRLNETRHRLTFPRDVAVRYPVLCSTGGRELSLPVSVEILEELNEPTAPLTGQLTLAISRDGTKCLWVYDAEIYTTENLERMARQFGHFLQGLAAEPERSLSRQPLMSASELQQILVDWNDTAAEYPKGLCVHQLFEAQVERTPDATAVVWEAERLSYRELNQRANQVAHYLRQQGVGPESLVGICVERSLEMVVGILGILKAGGAYVPLDPAYPEHRLAYAMKDAQCIMLLTQKRILGRLANQPAKAFCLDSAWNEIDGERDSNPTNLAKPNNLAYVIYTSGSTGKPKGVQIEHQALVNLVFWHQRAFAVSSGDRATQIAGTGFDAAVWELWPYLAAGASIYIPNDEVRASPSALLAWIVSKAITISFLPTPLAENTLAIPWPANLALRILLTGGDRLNFYPPSSLSVKLINNYGPTEGTVVTTSGLVTPNPRSAKSPHIGRPIDNMRVYLLDKQLQPVPIGVPGELYIGGDGLARGYLNRPELTEERFVANRFSSQSGTRLYKTGDLARYSSNGDIELLGRMDHQVKIRGFRIELGEVESVLRQCPGVSACVVVAREDVPGDKRLVAYLSGQNQALPDTAEFRRLLKEKLPDYMVPAAFVKLGALPLTPNGKVDRRALPKPDPTQVEMQQTFAAPRDSVEEKLVGIWQEVLGLHPVGVKDNYFSLGGDSLQAVRMFVQIEEFFHKKLPLGTLFQAPTIEQLAILVRTQEAATTWSLLVPIQPHGSKPPFFCIHARGGNVLFYRDLANRLGSDQPFYGLQAQGLDGKQPYLTRVEDMAARYIREIKTIQPEGPYFLGGSSFGGTAAFEMAQQLHAGGDEVALLAVFDTGGPGYPKTVPVSTFTRYQQAARNFTRRVHHYLWALRTLESGQRIPYVREKARKAKVKYIRQFRRVVLKFARKLPPAVGQSLFSSYLNARWALFEFEISIGHALASYVHPVYPGRMTLFRASKQPLGIYPDPTLGWKPFVAGGLEIHEVPGNHGTIMVEPGVRFLAEKLKPCMAEAQLRAQTVVTVERATDIVPARANREFTAMAVHQSS